MASHSLEGNSELWSQANGFRRHSWLAGDYDNKLPFLDFLANGTPTSPSPPPPFFFFFYTEKRPNSSRSINTHCAHFSNRKHAPEDVLRGGMGSDEED